LALIAALAHHCIKVSPPHALYALKTTRECVKLSLGLMKT
jgi:hypothetical protein